MKQDPPQEDEVPEPGDTVIQLGSDGVPIIYTEPAKGKGNVGQRGRKQQGRK